MTAVPINRALAVPTDAPVSDVTGYDPHMRSRAFFIAGAAAFLVFGAGSVALLMHDGVDLLLFGGGWGPVLNPYPFYFLITAAAGALTCLAVAHIRHVAFCRAHPFVSNFYTDDDHERARRLSGFSRIAACALAMLGAAIAVIQGMSLQHVSGGLSSLVVCCSAAALVAMYGSLMARRIDVEAYNQRAELLHGGCDVRVRFALIVAAVTVAAAIGSLFFVLSAWSQILIWGAIFPARSDGCSSRVPRGVAPPMPVWHGAGRNGRRACLGGDRGYEPLEAMGDFSGNNGGCEGIVRILHLNCVIYPCK